LNCFIDEPIENNSAESSSSPTDEIGERLSPIITYPQLVMIAMEVMIQFMSQFECEEEKLVWVLSRLGALCHDSAVNSRALCKEGLIKMVLNGFRPCLLSSDSTYPNLRSSVLALLTDLAREYISSEELKTYLQLFKTQNPPCVSSQSSLPTIENNLFPV